MINQLKRRNNHPSTSHFIILTLIHYIAIRQTSVANAFQLSPSINTSISSPSKHRYYGTTILKSTTDNSNDEKHQDKTPSAVLIMSESANEKRGLVRNFRQAAFLPRIYRCASTDGLADLFHEAKEDLTVSTEEHDILLQRAGLVIDLRSPSERDEERARVWMKNAPGGEFTVRDMTEDNEIRPDKKKLSFDRTVLRIDVLSPSRLFNYLTQNWLSPTQQMLSSLFFAIDGNKLHELRMEALNSRGLPGLYEAILKTSQEELCMALREITEYLEMEDENGAVVIHCVQGKDRTGLLIMLCQSILNLTEEEIIHDYHLSDQHFTRSSAATDSLTTTKKGKLDKTKFRGAPREAMEQTLSMIKKEYGSICDDGYLDEIGFDSQWRQRFVAALFRYHSPSFRNRL